MSNSPRCFCSCNALGSRFGSPPGYRLSRFDAFRGLGEPFHVNSELAHLLFQYHFLPNPFRFISHLSSDYSALCIPAICRVLEQTTFLFPEKQQNLSYLVLLMALTRSLTRHALRYATRPVVCKPYQQAQTTAREFSTV
jgi:hypothetical protein